MRHSSNYLRIFTLAAVALAAGSQMAHADSKTFVASGNITENGRTVLYSATAIFTSGWDGIVGHTGTMTLELRNSAAFDNLFSQELLSGAFWDVSKVGAALTKQDGLYTSDSSIVNGSHESAPSGNPGLLGTRDVSGEWTYSSSLSVADRGKYGVGASGLGGTFGAGDLFKDGAKGHNFDRDNSQGPDGLDYAILNNGDDTATSHAGQLTGDPFIKNGVLFTWTGVNFNAADINNVSFAYGTSLDDPSPSTVPEPVFYQLGALLGMGGLGMVRFRRKSA